MVKKTVDLVLLKILNDLDEFVVLGCDLDFFFQLQHLPYFMPQLDLSAITRSALIVALVLFLNLHGELFLEGFRHNRKTVYFPLVPAKMMR